MIAGRIFGRAVTLSAAIALAYALPVDAAELTPRPATRPDRDAETRPLASPPA